jgi:hypothetical protein
MDDLPPVDVDGATAERIRARAQRILARQADPDTRSAFGRGEAAFARYVEGPLVALFSVSLVVWAVYHGFG